LVYLPKKDKKLAARVVAALLAQDYVSGLFVDDSLGKFPGTLPLTAVNLKGSALTPMPAIAVNEYGSGRCCGRAETIRLCISVGLEKHLYRDLATAEAE